MKIKHILLAMLSVALLLSLSACGSDSSNNPTPPPAPVTTTPEVTAPTPAVAFEPVAGELIDAGNVRAICPEGWFNSPVSAFSNDPDETDPDALLFLKGTDDRWTNGPIVKINFYGVDHEIMSLEDQMSYFETAVALTPFTIGENVWLGYSYDVGDSIVEAVLNQQGSGAVDILVRLEGDGQTITLADPDIQTIISTIAY